MKTAFLTHLPIPDRRSQRAPGEAQVAQKSGVVTVVVQVPAGSKEQGRGQQLLDDINRALEQQGVHAKLMAVADIDILDESSTIAAAVADEQKGNAANEGATARALARGEARLVTWTQDGTLVEGSKLEEAWGVKRQTIDAARERGELFSLWVKGKHWYAAEALKFERPALAAVTRALGDLDSSSKLLFLLRKHGALKGLTPADAVERGLLDDVERLAHGWARD